MQTPVVDRDKQLIFIASLSGYGRKGQNLKRNLQGAVLAMTEVQESNSKITVEPLETI